MIDDSTMILSALSGKSFADIRTAFIARARLEAGRVASEREILEASGFEVINASVGQLITDDGREILHAHGKAWALKPEIHAARLEEAFRLAKERDKALAAQSEQVKAASPKFCTQMIDGQLCGGDLLYKPVCPSCSLGKSGVAATTKCKVCDNTSAIMRE